VSDFETVPVALIITGFIFGFTFHVCCISVVRISILKSSQPLTWVHFCLLILQYLLTHMFLLHYHGLWCPVYCWEWFCPFALVHSTT
jgi:hypothetical protein